MYLFSNIGSAFILRKISSKENDILEYTYKLQTNEYKEVDLIERIQKAETAPIHPILMQAIKLNGEK